MGLLQESEAARWLNSLTSQAGVEEKQYIREKQTTPRLGVGEKEGRKEEKLKEKEEMEGREQEKAGEK